MNATPLMQAAFSKEVSVQAMLDLVRTNDPKAVDRDGRTALMLAAWQGGAAKVRALLPLSDPHQTDHQGVNALMIAAGMGDPDRVAALVPVSDPQARDQHGMNALMHAVRNAKVDHLPMLSRVCPVDVRDRDGDTLLAYALKAGPKTLQTVLAMVPVDLRNHKEQTGLMLAAQAPSRPAQVLLPMLLAAGADPLLADAQGMTALHHAARTSDAALDLLWPVSDHAARDHEGHTVLHQAASGTSMVALGAVLDRWPSHRVDEPDARGRTPLHCLCERSADARGVALLLAAGADPNAADVDGVTPLLAVVQVHALESTTDGLPALELLLAAGADVMHRPVHGEGLLDRLVVDEGTLSTGSWDVLYATLPHLSTTAVRVWADGHGLLNLDDPAGDDHDRRTDLNQRLIQREQQELQQTLRSAENASTVGLRPRL